MVLGMAMRLKKPAWNKPSNVLPRCTSHGAASWPALSESTRVSPKPSSSDSVKSLSDGSTSASQVVFIMFYAESSIASPL